MLSKTLSILFHDLTHFTGDLGFSFHNELIGE